MQKTTSKKTVSKSTDFGGKLRNSRKGRAHPRPIDPKNAMHVVLRSSQAVGKWSFKKPKNEAAIKEIVSRFSDKYGVRLQRLGNTGDHLHLQIKLPNRQSYSPFVRAVTGSIAMAVTGASRWNKVKGAGKSKKVRFWDLRPFTRVAKKSEKPLNLREYLAINALDS